MPGLSDRYYYPYQEAHSVFRSMLYPGPGNKMAFSCSRDSTKYRSEQIPVIGKQRIIYPL